VEGLFFLEPFSRRKDKLEKLTKQPLPEW
jgi:hypothetical protein